MHTFAYSLRVSNVYKRTIGINNNIVTLFIWEGGTEWVSECVCCCSRVVGQNVFQTVIKAVLYGFNSQYRDYGRREMEREWMEEWARFSFLCACECICVFGVSIIPYSKAIKNTYVTVVVVMYIQLFSTATNFIQSSKLRKCWHCFGGICGTMRARKQSRKFAFCYEETLKS